MKIIIAGDGKVGLALTRRLSIEGHDITLIDSNADVLESIVEEFDVMSVCGNCAYMDVLTEAGVKTSDLLIAATSSDETNLICCETAKGLNPKINTIGRIRNPEFSKQIYDLPGLFDLSLSVNPDRQAAIEIGRVLKYPGFLKRDTFSKGRVEIVELKIAEDSKLCGSVLYKLYDIVKSKVLVCAVIRDDEVIIPDGNFVLQSNDRIFVTAAAENLTSLLKNLGIISHKVKDVIIAGGGRISYYLTEELLKQNMSVKIIEKDYNRCVELSDKFSSACIVHGDASSKPLLEVEGLDKCDALVTLTGQDELNMILSLYGNRNNVPQIVTKLSHMENTKIMSQLLSGTVICPKEMCTDTIVKYVRAMQNKAGNAKTIHLIADAKAEAIEFKLDENCKNLGIPLKNMKMRKNILIACITKKRRNIAIPNGDSTFEKDDTVLVVTSSENAVRSFNDIFE